MVCNWQTQTYIDLFSIKKLMRTTRCVFSKLRSNHIAIYELESVYMTPLLCRQIDASLCRMVKIALSITGPENTYTAELTQNRNLGYANY